MKAKQKRALAVRCPTCGARAGEKCELGSGQPRTDPHQERRLAAWIRDDVTLQSTQADMWEGWLAKRLATQSKMFDIGKLVTICAR